MVRPQQQSEAQEGSEEEVLLSPAGPVAQPEPLRRVQQQERVGVNVGSTEAHEDRVKAAVCTCTLLRDAMVVRTSAHMHLYAVTFHSTQ